MYVELKFKKKEEKKTLVIRSVLFDIHSLVLASISTLSSTDNFLGCIGVVGPQHYGDLMQGWANYDPRAICGPLSLKKKFFSQ